MRQFVFVVVMVAAAFVGGAVVNGPGFRWVQARLLDYMGLKDGGEIASVDLPQPPLDSADLRRPFPSSSTGGEGRAAATASSIISSNPRQDQRATSAGVLNRPSTLARSSGGLVDERTLQGRFEKSRAKAAKNTASSQLPSEESSPPLPVPTAIPEPAAPRLGNESGDLSATSSAAKKRPNSSQVPDSPAPAQGTDSQSGLPASLDASIGPALLASLSPSPATQPQTTNQTGSDAVPLETAPASSSPASLALSSGVSSTGLSSTSTSAVTPDWGNLRHKMQVLGVTRYTIEGEPGGQVMFSCLIPLAGCQAVAQRFEAEGEDELRAAHAALRRVALWRAAQSAASCLPTPPR